MAIFRSNFASVSDFLHFFCKNIRVVSKILLSLHSMKWLRKVWTLYYDGFRSMTIGRTLWLVIAIKLVIIFVVLKLFFFPNYIKEHAPKGQEAEFVSQRLNIEH